MRSAHGSLKQDSARSYLRPEMGLTGEAVERLQHQLAMQQCQAGLGFAAALPSQVQAGMAFAEAPAKLLQCHATNVSKTSPVNRTRPCLRHLKLVPAVAVPLTTRSP